MHPIIETSNLSYRYSKEQEIFFPNLRIEKNTLLSGDSGKGKTTLLHLLSGILVPQQGEINILKQAIQSLSETKRDQFRAHNIGLIFQRNIFLKGLSMKDNLLVAQKEKNEPFVLELLEKLQVDQLAHKNINKLSEGQLQRFSIARAFLNKPQVILADEPTSSLDNNNCEKFIQLLSEFSLKYNATLVVASHDERIKNALSATINL